MMPSADGTSVVVGGTLWKPPPITNNGGESNVGFDSAMVSLA